MTYAEYCALEREAGPGERLRIPSLDIELDVDAVYRDALPPD